MYSELINRLKPKPAFNLRWYTDKDLYSDGPAEDLIIKMIAENEPEKYTEAILQNMNWPVYYYLTHQRKNILNWYPFKKDGSVLEIGCGMGAITSMLCDKCHDVTAVELSKRRATATLLRCRDKENLEIIVGNLNDIEFEKTFDYITLIGVLEYQGTFTDTKNPYLDFLAGIKKLLKPDGKLLVAIENKYGLKYWCGAGEDHTGIPFEGMNQYSISNSIARTFAKKELEDLIKSSGFAHTFFYYPMPDYKLPTVIYSQSRTPKDENMYNMQPYYIPDNTTLVANEMDIYKDIIDNDVFGFFANSFLVECSDDADLGIVTESILSSERLEKYRIGTVFTKNHTVEKFPLSEAEGAAHVEQILKNTRAMEGMGRGVLPTEFKDGKLVSPYVQDELLENQVMDACKKGDIDRFYQLLDRVYQEILASSEQIAAEENIFYTMQIDTDSNSEKYGPIMRIGYLDMILRNAFYADGEIRWFDQEWILECVPARFIFFRSVVLLYSKFPWIEEIIPIAEAAGRYQLLTAWQEFDRLDNMFLGITADLVHIRQGQILRGQSKAAYLDNIKKLL